MMQAVLAIGRGRHLLRGLAAAAFTLAGTLCAAQSFGLADWTVSTEAGAQLLYGTAHEYVYDGNTGNKISELDWDIKPVLTLASRLLVQHRRTWFELSCALGLDGDRGIMTDSDWLNEASGDTGTKTNYSESTAMGTGFTDLGLSVRQSFRISRTVDLSSFVGFRYIDIAWSAQGGWLQYASDYVPKSSPPYYVYTTGTVEALPTGTVSTYEQRYYAAVFGAEVDLALSREFSFHGSLHLSPIVFASDLDYHALRDVTFADSMSGGFLFQPALSFVWSPGSQFSFRLGGAYLLIGGLKGSDTETAGPNSKETNIAPGQTIVYPNSAGADIEFLSAELSATLRL